jgi:hypothetical protein
MVVPVLAPDGVCVYFFLTPVSVDTSRHVMVVPVLRPDGVCVFVGMCVREMGGGGDARAYTRTHTHTHAHTQA